MPLSKSGKYFSNPAQMRQADAMQSAVDDISNPDDEQQENDSPAVSHHIFKTADGFHSTSQHEDGSTKEADHGSLDEALDDARACFGGGDEMEEGEEMEHGIPGAKEEESY